MAKKKNLLVNSEISRAEDEVEEVCFTDYVEPPEGSICLFSFAGVKPKKRQVVKRD